MRILTSASEAESSKSDLDINASSSTLSAFDDIFSSPHSFDEATPPKSIKTQVSKLSSDEKDKLRRQALRIRARFDFISFCEYCFKDKEGNFWKLQPFHKEWVTAINQYDRLIVKSPTDTGKTEMITIAYAIFSLGINPELRIAIISKVDRQASKFLRAIRDNIANNQYIKEVFPNLKPKPDPVFINRNDKWSDHEMVVARKSIDKDPSVQSLGVKGPLIGSRIDLMLLDDVLDKENTSTSYQMEEVNKWFDSTVASRLTEKCHLICINPPWDKRDLVHHLATKDGYHCITYSVLEENKEEYPNHRHSKWPSRFTPERIEQWKRDLGSKDFARFKRCILEESEENPFSIFVSSMLKTSNPKNILIDDTGLVLARAKKWMKFGGVDFSSSTRPGTCIFTSAISSHGEIVAPYDIEYGAWKPQQVASKICDHYEKHKHMIIYAENNAIQETLLEWAKDEAGRRGITLPIKPFLTGRNKADPQIGVSSLSVDFENGYVSIYKPSNYRHTTICACGFCKFIHELRKYPAGYMDGIMAFWFSIRAYKDSTNKARPRIRSFNIYTPRPGPQSDASDEVDAVKFFDNLTTDVNFQPSDYYPENRISLERGYRPGPNYGSIFGLLRRLKYEDIEALSKGLALKSATPEKNSDLYDLLNNLPAEETISLADDIYRYCYALRVGEKL